MIGIQAVSTRSFFYSSLLLLLFFSSNKAENTSLFVSIKTAKELIITNTTSLFFEKKTNNIDLTARLSWINWNNLGINPVFRRSFAAKLNRTNKMLLLRARTSNNNNSIESDSIGLDCKPSSISNEIVVINGDYNVDSRAKSNVNVLNSSMVACTSTLTFNFSSFDENKTQTIMATQDGIESNDATATTGYLTSLSTARLPTPSTTTINYDHPQDQQPIQYYHQQQHNSFDGSANTEINGNHEIAMQHIPMINKQMTYPTSRANYYSNQNNHHQNQHNNNINKSLSNIQLHPLQQVSHLSTMINNTEEVLSANLNQGSCYYK